jgi:phosphopentomutase
LPSPTGPLDPLPRVLAANGLATSAHMAAVPWLLRGLARRIVATLGVAEAGFHGGSSSEILRGALPALRRRDRGLVVLHWPDADRAGHRHAWMSRAYAAAARRMDDALGALVDEVGDRSRTMLIALADHGGGGVDPRHHDSAHPRDRTIPMVFAGGPLAPGPLPHGVSLLDVPATILWALGLPQPASYAGRPVNTLLGERRAVA